jgi:transposase
VGWQFGSDCTRKVCGIKKTFLYAERDEAARTEFLNHLLTLPKHSLVFIDETGIDHTLRRSHGWGPCGQPLFGEKPGKRKERTSVIAALHHDGLKSAFCFQGYCNTDVFLLWVKAFLIPDLVPGQTVIMDNARFHKDDAIRLAIEAARCQLLYLPPYSPDLNDIEPWWAPIKKRFASIAPNYTSTDDAINATLNHYCVETSS